MIIYRMIEIQTLPHDLHASVNTCRSVRPLAMCPRPVGRPRVGCPSSCPARRAAREILSAAAGVVSSNTGTPPPRRAPSPPKVGLRQASCVFHYFARKDDILSELLEPHLAPHPRGGAPATTWKIMSLTWPFAPREGRRWPTSAVARTTWGRSSSSPRCRNPQFEWFWPKAVDNCSAPPPGNIARGVASGAFAEADRRHRGGRRPVGLVESVITADRSMRRRSATPSVIADASLRICGVAPSRVHAIGRRAQGFRRLVAARAAPPPSCSSVSKLSRSRPETEERLNHFGLAGSKGGSTRKEARR